MAHASAFDPQEVERLALTAKRRPLNNVLPISAGCFLGFHPSSGSVSDDASHHVAYFAQLNHVWIWLRGYQVVAVNSLYEPAAPQWLSESELLAGQLEVKPSAADQHFTGDIV